MFLCASFLLALFSLLFVAESPSVCSCALVCISARSSRKSPKRPANLTWNWKRTVVRRRVGWMWWKEDHELLAAKGNRYFPSTLFKRKREPAADAFDWNQSSLGHRSQVPSSSEHSIILTVHAVTLTPLTWRNYADTYYNWSCRPSVDGAEAPARGTKLPWCCRRTVLEMIKMKEMPSAVLWRTSLGIAHSSVWKIENHSSAASPEAQPTMSMAEIDEVDICRFIIFFFTIYARPTQVATCSQNSGN